jgi:hypothetical protein
MLLYITDSKKTKHTVRVEGIESITFTNNPAIITFNYLNGSKKELHMVEQDLKVPSDAYVVDKLWAWVNSGLSDKPKQLTSFLGKKAKVDTVKSVETDEEHSENKTYLRISKFHDSFVEKKVIPVDDITSVTAHSEDGVDYLLFITKHKKYKLVLVYTYSDVYASDINDDKHAANLIKDDIIDLIQKAKNKGVVTYNPIEFVSFSYKQPYAETGVISLYGENFQTWNVEEVFNFTENYDEIQTGKKQDTCLYAFNMHDVIVNAHGETPAQSSSATGLHSYEVDTKSFIQLGSTRSQVDDLTITNVKTMPPLGFTYDLLNQENLEGTGKWLGQWAPSKAYYSIQGYDTTTIPGLLSNSAILDSVPENPSLHNDVILSANIDINNEIPPLTKWNLHSEVNDGTGTKFFTFWDSNAKEYKDVSVDTLNNKRYIYKDYPRQLVFDNNIDSSKTWNDIPNVFNPVYGMLCKEDGVYRVSVNFEDIILTNSSSTSSEYNFLNPDQRDDVEAYLTVKIHEAYNPDSVIPFSRATLVNDGDVFKGTDVDIREQSFGPFLASERGFNIKSDFIIPGVENSTFFKFLLTIVNKSTQEKIYVHIDTTLEQQPRTLKRGIFGRSQTGIGFSQETAAKRFTNSALTQTWEVLDDDTLPYSHPVNRYAISLLHIEKIAELPRIPAGSNSIPFNWQNHTEETTESGEKFLKSLRGVSRNVEETASGYGYSYGGSDGIGTGNL